MSVFSVSKDCFELGLRAGALVLRDVKIEEASRDLRCLIDDEVQQVQNQLSRPADVRSLPEISALHHVLRRVGVRPRSHPPSTQKLIEFALKKQTLPAVNNLVDAYNLISVRTRCSLGAHDLDRLSLPVQLRLFDGSEEFRPLGSAEQRQVKPGEFGYVDARHRVICRLDSLQAEFSKVTAESVNVLLIIEGTHAQDSAELRNTFAETQRILSQFCGGTAEVVAFAD